MLQRAFFSRIIAFSCFVMLFAAGRGVAQDRPATQAKVETQSAETKSYTRTEDVIYGRKDGVALTMDIFTPKKANGAAIIEIVSGGYFSSHAAISPAIIEALLKRGYTVFCVVHGSQPRYQVPEIFQDIQRASRFIHLHAKDYGIDSNRIGVTGASAGGNLSLLLGTAGTKGNPEAGDPVEKESSRVQAVACFFPPTDFLNYGGPGVEHIKYSDFDPRFRASFDYRERDPKTNTYERVADPEKLKAITRGISPIYFVSHDTPPTLMMHGDVDKLVPLQQSQSMLEKLKEAGVPAELIVKKGGDHGWFDIIKDVDKFGDWFDRYLGKHATSK
jgi:acetyl esterase/lipase